MHELQNSKDLDALIEDIGDAQVVMLGEASHGTHEYYTWRTAITKRLIQEKDSTLLEWKATGLIVTASTVISRAIKMGAMIFKPF